MISFNQLISVVIPVYNVSLYLEKSVRSVMVQTYKNLEIILIDDGSTDDSGLICDRLQKEDSRIRVIHQRNAGLSMARNVGYEASHGEWIAFLDSDDWIEPKMYEILYNLAVEFDADISSCKIRKVYCDGKIEETFDTQEVKVLYLDDIIKGLPSQQIVRFEVWNKLWKRSLIGDIRFVPQQICEDVHFDRILFTSCKKFVYIDQTLHNYMVLRPGSTASSFKPGREFMLDEFYIWIEDIQRMGRYDLSGIIGNIAIAFAADLYTQSVVFKQEKSYSDRIYSKYMKLYKSTRPYAKTTLQYRLFAFNPKLYQMIQLLVKMVKSYFA